MKKIIIGSLIVTWLPFQFFVAWYLLKDFNVPDSLLFFMSFIGFLVTCVQGFFAVNILIAGYQEKGILKDF